MTTKSLAGLTAAIVVAVVAGIGAAWAGGDRGHDKTFGGRGHFGHFGGPGMGFDSGRMHRMLTHLDLSPEQERGRGGSTISRLGFLLKGITHSVYCVLKHRRTSNSATPL